MVIGSNYKCSQYHRSGSIYIQQGTLRGALACCKTGHRNIGGPRGLARWRYDTRYLALEQGRMEMGVRPEPDPRRDPRQ